MWPLETTLSLTVFERYNALDAFHLITFKYASSCVRKIKQDTFKPYYSIQE